ncbi:MAG: hypothetical protein IKE01_06605 [Clostridia bacterium]|nr:hypothetical protein [Clostridia bacterium]
MKCPICGKEFSDPILPLHVARCSDNQKDSSDEKSLEKMNKKELLEKAKELEIVIEDENKINKAQIIELINQKDSSDESENPQE